MLLSKKKINSNFNIFNNIENFNVISIEIEMKLSIINSSIFNSYDINNNENLKKNNNNNEYQ